MFANRFGRFGAVPATRQTVPIPVDIGRHLSTGDYRPMATHPWHPGEESFHPGFGDPPRDPHMALQYRTGYWGFSGPSFGANYGSAGAIGAITSANRKDGPAGHAVVAAPPPSSGTKSFGQIDFSSVGSFLNSPYGMLAVLGAIVAAGVLLEKRGIVDFGEDYDD